METSKATDNSSIKNSAVRDSNLQDESPLIQMLKGVIVIGQYKEGNLARIWFLEDGLTWKEATPLKKYLSIEESIPDGQTTTVAHIATYPPRAIQSLGKQTKEDQHSFILSMLSRTESEVANSTDLRYLLALLEFPVLRIGKHPHSYPATRTLTPTTTKVTSATKETEPSVSKKIGTKVVGTGTSTEPTEEKSASHKPIVSEPVPPRQEVAESIPTKASEAISTKTVHKIEPPFKPTGTKAVPVNPEEEPSTGANTEINVGTSEKAENPIPKSLDSSPANLSGDQVTRTVVSSEQQPQQKEEKEISASQPQEKYGLSREVTVTRIFWSLDKYQGTIIPTVYFDPIKLGNSNHLKIAGQSYGFLEKERIGRNSRIVVGMVEENSLLKFIKTIIPQKAPMPDLKNIYQRGSNYNWDNKTVKEIEERLGTFLEELNIEKDSSEVSKVMAFDLGITSVPQLIFITKKDPTTKYRFQNRISDKYFFKEYIYDGILAAIDDPSLDWDKLVFASSSFDLNKINEKLLRDFFKAFTIGDLKEIQEKNADFSPLLEHWGFSRNEINGIKEGTEKFEHWWNENSPFLAVERNQIFYSTILGKIKGKKILVYSSNADKSNFLKKLGASITEIESRADMIIIDSEYENLKSMEEDFDFEYGREDSPKERESNRRSKRQKPSKKKKDQIKLSWDDFIEDYLREAS